MTPPLDTRFPASVQEIWAALSAKVVALHGRWVVYCQIFGTNEERIELFNDAASYAARIFHDALFSDVMLALARVGDPGIQGKKHDPKRNLSVLGLQQALREANVSSLATQMEAPLKEFEAARNGLKTLRNKWIAHNDLDTSLEARTTPLRGPTRDEIENALYLLRQIMNLVASEYTGSQMLWEPILPDGDGEDLIHALMCAKRYEELVREGAVGADDLSERFPVGS